ncbi:MAG: cytidylate kinase-like family protein [Porphyromonas sp.]|nr:cytidylate kinase-like family protein [Porphyromonas sp.]
MAEFSKDTFAICVGRSYGSGGLSFAHALSKRLGIPLYDKNILDEAAKDSNIRRDLFEKADEHGTFSMPMVYGADYGVAPPSLMVCANNLLSNENLFNIQSDVIRDLAAKHSAIFVGRAADFILKDHPNLFSIFIAENEELRITRIKKRQNLESDKEAHKEMERQDKTRRDYYNFYTAGRWGRAENYDLSLQLSYFGIDYAVDLVVDVLRHKGFPLREDL